jgi:hypothetical protein
MGWTDIKLDGGAYYVPTVTVVSGKKKKKGRATPAQDQTDPYNLIAAKTTAGHKAVWNGGHGHYVPT